MSVLNLTELPKYFGLYSNSNSNETNWPQTMHSILFFIHAFGQVFGITSSMVIVD